MSSYKFDSGINILLYYKDDHCRLLVSSSVDCWKTTGYKPGLLVTHFILTFLAGLRVRQTFVKGCVTRSGFCDNIIGNHLKCRVIVSASVSAFSYPVRSRTASV